MLRGLCVPMMAMIGCGTPNPRVLDATEEARPAKQSEDGELSEADKIRKLLDIVRNSAGTTFVQGGNERDAPSAAAHLERRLARVPAGIPTARQFVDRVAAGRLRAPEPDKVKRPDGTTVSAHDWFLDRLAEIEGRPLHISKQVVAQGPQKKARTSAGKAGRQLGILDALQLVEQSRLRFVAPPRRAPNGKLKGKRKEYSATEFSEMLRKKWEFLGADVHDLDGFIEEIATDAFATFEPYRVVLEDGTEREFRAWLLEQLAAEREAVAQGGAP